MSYRIRKATAADVRHLGEVERAAAVLFPAGRVPDPDEVTPAAELDEARSEGLLFVADLGGTPVGFATCSIEGDRLHLDELAVHPDHGRRGLGRNLVQAVIDEASARGLTGVSLTTFADLPWNGPFYTAMEFRTLSETELDGPLADALANERAKGLTERIAMFWAARPGAP